MARKYKGPGSSIRGLCTLGTQNTERRLRNYLHINLSAEIYLLHRFGPFRFASAEHGGAVFLKNPPLLHQFVECVGITGQIVVPVGVALRNGLARIA